MTPKGWLSRKRGRLLYRWINSAGQERVRSLGPATLTDDEGWKQVGKLGLDVHPGRPDPTNALFGQVMQAYLDAGLTKADRDKAHSTKNTDKRNSRLHLSHWNRSVMQDIRAKDVKKWLGGKSTGLRHKLRSLMSAIFRYAQIEELIPEGCDPMRLVSASAMTDYEAVTVSPEQAFLILEQIEDPLVRCFIILLACTAMRISEALALRWSDLDWQQGRIFVRRGWVDGEIGRPKSQASRANVEMAPALAAVLEAWRKETIYAQPDDYVFASYKLKGRQPRTGSTISQKYIRPAALKVGVITGACKRFGAHNLRHGLGTFVVQQGGNPELVAKMLRQSHVDMALWYVHNQKEAREAQGSFLSKFLPNGDTKRVQ